MGEQINLEDFRSLSTDEKLCKMFETSLAIKSRVAVVESSLAHFDERINENTSKISELVKQNQLLAGAVDELKQNYADLQKKVADDATKRDDSEAHYRKSMIEVSGIPQQPNETSNDCMRLVAKVLELARAPVSFSDIDDAHRKFNGGIFCKFKHRQNALAALACSSSLKGKSARDIPGLLIEGEPGKIFLNESLTTDRKKTLAQIQHKLKRMNVGKPWQEAIRVRTRGGVVQVQDQETRRKKCHDVATFDAIHPNAVPGRVFAN